MGLYFLGNIFLGLNFPGDIVWGDLLYIGPNSLSHRYPQFLLNTFNKQARTQGGFEGFERTAHLVQKGPLKADIPMNILQVVPCLYDQ